MNQILCIKQEPVTKMARLNSLKDGQPANYGEEISESSLTFVDPHKMHVKEHFWVTPSQC